MYSAIYGTAFSKMHIIKYISFLKEEVISTRCQDVCVAPPIGQIHPFSKIAVTFEPLKEF